MAQSQGAIIMSRMQIHRERLKENTTIYCEHKLKHAQEMRKHRLKWTDSQK